MNGTQGLLNNSRESFASLKILQRKYWFMIKASQDSRILFSVFCAFVLSGCNANSRNAGAPGTSAGRVATSSDDVGRDEERHGIMSKTDYATWAATSDKVSEQRRMDDNDVDWAISMMQKPSTDPAQLHEMMMGLFLTARTFGPGQQQKIRDAATPLLASQNPVEVKYAKAVLRGHPGDAH